MPKLRLLVLPFLVGLIALPPTVFAFDFLIQTNPASIVLECQPWLDGWSSRVKMTIDSDLVDADLTNFPVLVYLQDGGNFAFADALANGNDIRFTQSDGISLLAYERQYHTSPEAWYWVRLPSVSSSADTDFYVYYGNAGASDGAAPSNVWDSDFVAVYHLGEANTGMVIADSTGGHNAAKKSNAEPSQTTGAIGKGQDFDNTDDFINIANHADFDFTEAVTFELWAKHNSNAPEFILSNRTRSDCAVYMISDGKNMDFAVHIGNVVKAAQGSVALGITDWRYCAGTYDKADGLVKSYVDDNPADTFDSGGGNIDVTGVDYRIGWGHSDGYVWDGPIDEVRMSSIARSAAWIKASYHSGADGLITFGQEEIK